MSHEDDFQMTLPAFQPNPASDTFLAEQFTALFPLNPYRYITLQGYDNVIRKKETVTIKRPPTLLDVQNHLVNDRFDGTLGYLPTWAEETTVACIDIDRKDKAAEVFQQETDSIQAALTRHGVAFNLERSTNGGHHLWVFTSGPVRLELFRYALKIITAEAGHPSVEVFPKGNAQSNAIYLPYRGAELTDQRLGYTNLERPDGTPIPLGRVLDEVRVTPVEIIYRLAEGTNAKPPVAEQPTQPLRFDPAGYEALKRAALTPPSGLRRHDSIEGFLNVAERMGKGDEMAEYLKSADIYGVWVIDGSRTVDAWAAEIDRWRAGTSIQQFGLKSLLDQGWQLPNLPRLGEAGSMGSGKQSWQQAFEALRLKYAPHVDGAGQARRIRRYRAHEVRNIPQPKGLVGSLIVQQTLAALLGPSGAGKSMVGLDMALHVATGQDWREHAVNQGSVVWLAAESMEYTANRMEAWCNVRNVEPETLPFDLLDGYLSLTDVHPAGGLEELILTLKEIEAERGALALIVVDTVARTFGDGDENSNDDMKHFTDAAELLTRVFSATVLLVHHTGKDASRGGRGASAFKAPLTTELIVEKKGGLVQLSQTKNRGAADEGKPILLRFESHSWVVDGTEYTAGMVAAGEATPEVSMGRDLLTPQQESMLETLLELHADSETAIKRKDWQEACAERDIDRRRFNDNLKDLLSADVVREVIAGKTFEPVVVEA